MYNEDDEFLEDIFGYDDDADKDEVDSAFKAFRVDARKEGNELSPYLSGSVHRGTLYMYVAEVSVHQPFGSYKEELRCAALIAACKKQAQRYRHEHKNMRYAVLMQRQYRMYCHTFTKKNLRLVLYIARRCALKGLPWQDAIQAGNIGLMKAVERFDHKRGYKFSTYASWWILQAITREIASDKLVKVPVYIIERRSRVFAAIKTFRAEHGRRPTVQELVEKTGIRPSVAFAILDSQMFHVSLDDVTYSEDGKPQSLIETVEDESACNQESSLAERDMKILLHEALDTLDSRERKIIEKRFGMDGDKAQTLDAIGASFKLTRERIRQIERRALEKLAKSPLASRLKDFLYIQ